MHWRIITVGKPGHEWVRAGLEMYWRRLVRHARFEHVVVKEAPRPQVEAQIASLCTGALCVLLDERGSQMRSVDLARWIEKEEISSRKKVCVVIGGADGHSETFRSAADACWSLSTLTLQHDIALIVVVEQIYRAYSILRGEPYHRE